MAYTLKIANAVAKLKKDGVLDEVTFYRLLSEKCNYMDPEATRTFYMGLVQHMTSELRKHGVVRLPHIGDFYLLKQQNTKGWAGKHMAAIADKYLLKYDPKESWKDYFRKIADRGGVDGLLDPREKLGLMPKEEARESLGSTIIDPMDTME